MLKRHVIGVLILSVFIIGAACKKDQTSSNSTNNNTKSTQSKPDQFAAARTLFDQNCKGCHGQNGEGGPVTLKDGTRLKVPSLRDGHSLRHDDNEFIKQITKGGDGMPAFADKLKPDQMNEIVRFIRHDFQGK